MPLTITSSAFADGELIPRRYTCDGQDVSPPLEWSEPPAGTAAFAIVVTDPDARDFVHWVAYDIDAAARSLVEGASGPGGFPEGRNDFGRNAWGGPCPPSGTHRYVFDLYSLDGPLGLDGGAQLGEVERAMDGHVLAQARLLGRYQRS
jgi:hypothetical protein